MKYKYAFVKEVNSYSHDFYYCDELKSLFARYNMSDLYEAKFQDKATRWTPSMIFKELEKDDYEELCDCGKSYYESHICAYQ